MGEGAVPVGAGVAVAAGEVSAGELSAGGVSAPPATVKVNLSDTGCPSLETTRQMTVTSPAALPLSCCVSRVPSMTGSPDVRSVPAASVTTTSVAPGSSMSTPLKVIVISAGRASTRAPVAGSEPISSSCAQAGAPAKTMPMTANNPISTAETRSLV